MAAPYADYDAGFVRRRVASWPLFDPDVYLHLNRDLLPRTPEVAFDHYCKYGVWEGRRYTDEVHLVAALHPLAPEPTDAKVVASHAVPPTWIVAADIGVYTNSGSNFFMKEIAHNLASGLRELGLRVTEGTEDTAPDDRRAHTIIVAPHEFFILGNGKAWSRADIVTDSLMLSTEQPQTTWFSVSLPYLLSSRGIIELCFQSSAAFSAAGIDSHFFVPGLSAPPWLGTAPDLPRLLQNQLIGSLPQSVLDHEDVVCPLHDRPLDLVFMASESAIRNDFLSRQLAALRAFRSLILYRRLGRTVPKPYANDNEITAVNDFILQRSKFLLNVHRDSLGYFEVHRLGMQGMWNGCAVITNPCLPHPYFIPNEHYFEETIDRIPKLIEWLIESPEGRREAETVRWNGVKQYAAVGNSRRQAYGVAELIARSYGLGPSAP